MIRLIQAGQGTNSDSPLAGRFGPVSLPCPWVETEPRLFQYQPGTNLMMIPRMGYNSLPLPLFALWLARAKGKSQDQH